MPYVQAPAAWTDPGVHGGSQTIAVIDTGIDFYHADFAGSGDPADYTYGEAHDTVSPRSTPTGPRRPSPTRRSSAATTSPAMPTTPTTSPIPAPDPNPLDCVGADVGHGSHTAGTAAGFGVLSNGSTFSGPWDSSTYADNTFAVGPGVAPLAKILSYRVFGCGGSTSLVTLAINQAVADGANVISMSLGSDFAPVPLADDPDVIASDNAAGAGIVVVASSGNEGPGAYITGAPAAASRSIAVAAIDGSTPTLPGAHIVAGTATVDGALNDNIGLGGGITAPLVVLSDGAGGIGFGCARATTTVRPATSWCSPGRDLPTSRPSDPRYSGRRPGRRSSSTTRPACRPSRARSPT